MRIAIALTCMMVSLAALANKVILDSDMYEDYDDAGALAILHALADAGECEILATLSCTRGNGSVAAMEIMNHYYGRGDIPVGCSKSEAAKHKFSGAHNKYLRLQKKYPNWFKYANSDDAPDAVAVYRKVLAAQPDKSVTICTIGYLSNLRGLLESKADEFSPLDGPELIKAKVEKWVAMACIYPKGHECNSDGDPIATKIALRDWPTPIVVSDFQYGRHLYTGRALLESKIENSPVKDAFVDLRPREQITPTTWDQMAGHPSWDQSAVLIAVRGENSYFALDRGSYEAIDDRATCCWRPDPNSRNCRVLERTPREEVGKIIDELMLKEPAKTK